MKKSFFILALLAVILQTVVTGVVYLRFELNRDYIAKNLCVKKEIKNNCCQGTCQLKKQLGDGDKKEKSPLSSSFKIRGQFNLFCQSCPLVHLIPSSYVNDLFIPYIFSKKPAPGFAVFHPPAC